MTAHPQADLLQQLADEAKVNPEPWRAFQYSVDRGKKWREHTSMFHFIDSLNDCAGLIRRKPRTIRVSGEVPEEVIKMARRASDPDGSAITASRVSSDIARALLSLVEES